MWHRLEKPWQESFKLSWEAYKAGNIPIGAVIVDEGGEILARGQNQIFDNNIEGSIIGTNMAHAEMMALLGIKEKEHPYIRDYRLYTTMEPCPMCFGTAVMMNIRNISYASKDGFAGATELKNNLDYIKKKNIDIEWIGGEAQAFQLILQSAYEYERQHPKVDIILQSWRAIDSLAVDYGEELCRMEYFPQAIEEDKPIDMVYKEVINKYLELSKYKRLGYY